MKIYTRRGDAGETDLFGGPRVGKDHLRVEAYGAVDELNAILGQAAAASTHPDLVELSQDIQSRLFDLGSQLATPDPKSETVCRSRIQPVRSSAASATFASTSFSTR